MSAAFTPGPWTARSRSAGIGPTDDYDNDFLGWEIVGPPDAERGQFARAADARLIAAVPDLYAALVAIANHVKRVNGADHTCGDCRECYGIADEALAKAEGREP